MYIWMIWAKGGLGVAGTSGNEVWLVEAWDESSTSDNSEGWAAAKEKAYADHGVENVVINRHLVNFDKVLSHFNTPVEI